MVEFGKPSNLYFYHYWKDVYFIWSVKMKKSQYVQILVFLLFNEFDCLVVPFFIWILNRFLLFEARHSMFFWQADQMKCAGACYESIEKNTGEGWILRTFEKSDLPRNCKLCARLNIKVRKKKCSSELEIVSRSGSSMFKT